MDPGHLADLDGPLADLARHSDLAFAVWSPSPDGGAPRLVMLNEAARPFFQANDAATTDTALPFSYVVEELVRRVAKTGRAETVAADWRPTVEPAEPRFLSVKATRLREPFIGVSIEDVTPEMRVARIHEAEQRVLEAIAAGTSATGALDDLALTIESVSPGTLVSILLLDDTGTRLLLGAAPSLPQAYNDAIHGVRIGPNVGSCGTSAFLAAPVFVRDIDTDPLWTDYRALALSHGLHACWSMPILGAGGNVLGTFAMYHREPRTPASADVDLIRRASHVARIAIERRRLDGQLRALSARIEAEREDERAGIAREIHDQLGQAITALCLDIGALSRLAAKSDAPMASEVGERTSRMRTIAEGLLEQVRRISAELRPWMLDDLGLAEAVDWQAREFERRSNVRCRVESTLSSEPLDRAIATAAYRILQEALTNVARHAQADDVLVRVWSGENALRLTVEDNGRGIDPSAIHRSRSLGLLGMRERARRLGGHVTIQPGERGGTRLSLDLPMAGAAVGAR